MKKFFAFALVAMFAVSASAQLLWKVQVPGLKRTSYLFGTHHVAPASMIDEVPGLAGAIEECSAIYGEVSDEEMASPEMNQTMMMAMMAPADSTLTVLLNKEQQDSLTQFITKYAGQPVPIEALAPMKPAAVGVQLAMMLAMAEFPDFDPAKQLDMEIQRRGVAAGKQRGALETAQEQLDLLFGQPLTEQVGDLMDVVRKEDRSIALARDLAAAYTTRDLDKIAELAFNPDNMSASEAQRMIYDRNVKWAQKLGGIIPTGSVLVAVGAAHLPGEQGLIALLRNAGFTVEPVTE